MAETRVRQLGVRRSADGSTDSRRHRKLRAALRQDELSTSNLRMCFVRPGSSEGKCVGKPTCLLEEGSR